jgi:LEA14-like dessication related protein
VARTIPLLRLAALGYISLSLASCAALTEQLQQLDKPTVRLVSAEPSDISLEALTLQFDVEVLNPYSVDLPLTKIDYAVGSKTQALLSGTQETQTNIPAKGSKVIPVSANVVFLEALEVLKGVSPGAVIPYRADLGFSVDAPGLGLLRLPVKKEGEMPIPTAPDVSVHNVSFKDVELSMASLSAVGQAALQLEVGNTNQFPFDLSKLEYALNLGGTRVAGGTATSQGPIAAGETRVIEFPVEMALQNVGFGLINLLTGESADYGLAGDLGLDTPFGPISVPYTSSGETPLSN